MPVEFENGHVFGFAKARRTLGDDVKHWLELGRRGADDPQNLSHRRLLLERLGKPLFQLRFADRVNALARLRCLRTKTGNASSALRLFASQGHLVGTVTGPLSAGSSQGSSLSILPEPHDELAPVHSITSAAIRGTGVTVYWAWARRISR